MRVGLIVLLVLVGLNLRPALSSLAPLLARVQSETGLSAAAIGALTTLPVLCLGLFAPLAPWLSRRIGIERTLSLALLLLAAALALRASANIWPLYAGTALVGAAIGIAGTVLPVLVKRDLPRGADLMTGVYTMALCLGGALGAGLSIPLAEWLGSWQRSLASWSLLALFALVCWRLSAPHPVPDRLARQQSSPGRGLLRSPLAWQVTLLMGSQSSLAYIVFGWLPVLLQRRGVGEAEAGLLLGASVFVQLFAALAAPWLARLGRDQRPALVFLLLLIGIGFYCLLQGPPALRWPGVVALGLGQGGSFSLALTLLVLRSANPAVAGQLSGMTQGIGYCLAALGPLGVGIMLQLNASLTVIWAALTAVVAMAVGLALLAGRRLVLDLDAGGRFVTRRHRR
ncbi:MFS transporter [Haliea sp. E1-2-M8]|uniref:MFS transporter n=1 Tax=Haliea sp. E1-2-M8 TaxID=3064706 RepID=UPI00271D9481|nr:MFS transporter [Haliea sp. E1-2-M8]MDO8860488.1 MFS transporter [Haliea sp. E1-2-M8]